MIAAVLAGLAVAMTPAAAEDAIRLTRARHNAAIAARDLDGAMAVAGRDYVVTAASGDTMTKPVEVRQAWRRSFADPAFVRYVRTPTAIRIAEDGARAAEEGDWEGVFRDADGEKRPYGRYLVHWRLTDAGWRSVAETYVTLGEADGG